MHTSYAQIVAQICGEIVDVFLVEPNKSPSRVHMGEPVHLQTT